MKKNTLESLPNELLLIIFSYLSSFDLCRAFLHLKNARIERLITSIRHVLDVSSMHYRQLHQFLSTSNDDTTKHFTILIDTVVLRRSSACATLYHHWRKILNDNELFNIWLPSIKQLLVFNANYYGIELVQPFLRPLVFHNTLQHLHLVFERPTHEYSAILSQLVHYCISVHTMILEVEKGTSRKRF